MNGFEYKKVAIFSVVVILLVASIGSYLVFGPEGTQPGITERNESESISALGINATQSNRLSNLNQTRHLVESARAPVGGYTELRTEQPSVYATHYYLRTSKTLGIPLDHRAAMREWLQGTLDKDFSNQGIGTLSNDSIRYLRDYRDSVVSLSLLNATVQNRSDVIADIREFQTQNGLYCFAIDEQGDCRNSNSESKILATSYALTTLDRLNALNDTNQQSIRDQLITKWQNESIFESTSKISLVHKIVTSLDLLGVNVNELNGYKTRVSAIESQRSNIRRSINEGSITLLELQSYYMTINLLDGNVGKLDGAISKYLHRIRLADGGFSITGARYSDAKGTAIGTTLFAAIGENSSTSIADEEMRTLLRIQALESSGFAPTFRPQSTINRTFYAIQTLSAFGNHSVSSQTRQFVGKSVQQIRQKSTDDIALLYKITVLNRTANTKGFTNKELTSALDAFFERNDPSLREIHAAVRLATIIDYPVDHNAVVTNIRSKKNADGGFGPVSRSDTTYYAVDALSYLNASVHNRSATVEWVMSNRDEDKGYRFQNGNHSSETPDLYATYLSVRTLRHLEKHPNNSTELRHWVASLESPNGGFRLFSNATVSTSPTLKYTYLGTSTLAVLPNQ